MLFKLIAIYKWRTLYRSVERIASHVERFDEVVAFRILAAENVVERLDSVKACRTQVVETGRRQRDQIEVDVDFIPEQQIQAVLLLAAVRHRQFRILRVHRSDTVVMRTNKNFDRITQNSELKF